MSARGSMRRFSCYCPEAFEAAIRIAEWFPPAYLHRAANGAGFLAWRFAGRARAVQEENLSRVTGFQGEALQRLCLENFQAFTRSLASYCYAARLSVDVAGPLLFEEMIGREHMEAAVTQRRGAVLATAHFGAWELGNHLMAGLGYPLTIVTLQEPTPELDAWRRAYRERMGVQTITIGENPFAFVEMLSALRAGRFLAMLVDRPQKPSSVDVNWFGAKVGFSTGAALLAEKAQVPVIPVFIPETRPGRYRGVALAPVEMERGDGSEILTRNTQRLADAISGMVGSSAGQWFNYSPIFTSHA